MATKSGNKNTSSYNPYIKNYNLIRSVLREYYKYGGSQTIQDLKNKSDKSYHTLTDINRRITNYISDEYLADHKIPNRCVNNKAKRFIQDPYLCPINFLADTYESCTYDIKDFLIYFLLMQSFFVGEMTDSDGYSDEHCNYVLTHQDVAVPTDKGFSEKEFIDFIYGQIIGVEEALKNNNYIDDLPEPEEYLGVETIKRCFNDFIEAGILEPNGKKACLVKEYNPIDKKFIDEDGEYFHYSDEDYEKAKNELKLIGKPQPVYVLAPDIFKDLTAKELSNLYTMIQFYYNQSVLPIPGNFLASTIRKHYILLAKDVDELSNEQENPVFLYRHNNLHTALDNDLLWKLLCHISDKTPITLVVEKTYKKGEGVQPKDKLSKSFDVLPLKIVSEQIYGRQYLVSYSYEKQKLIQTRLDKIHDIEDKPKIKKKDYFPFLQAKYTNLGSAIEAYYKNNTTNVWNVDFGKEPYKVLVHFTCSPEEYNMLLNRVKSTGRNGEITNISPTGFDFTVTTLGYDDIKPWIRGFGSNAVVDKDVSPELYESIKGTYRKVLEKYGAL